MSSIVRVPSAMQADAGSMGVHRVPKLGFVNAYAVEVDAGRVVIVDTGTPGSLPKFEALLQSINRKPADVSHIILTHADADHSGSAARLKAATGATLAIHELDAPRIAGEEKLKEASGAGALLLGLFGLFMRVERVKPDLLLRDGSAIGPLTVIHTPGHTDGSVCVHLPGTALFAGDLLRTSKSGELELASPRMSRDMDQVRRSVEKVSRLEFKMLLPGHGEPIMDEAAARLRTFVANGFR